MMAKKHDAAAQSPAALTYTLQLAKPITDGDRRLDALTVVEPEVRHFVHASRKASPQETTIALIAQIAGISEDAAGRLKTRDARAVQKWIEGLRKFEPIEADVDEDDGRTFTLLSPLDGPPRVERLTLREPDLASGVAVEKFKTEAEQSAALIASLSGQTIPQIMRLKLRDMARVEAWLYPLLDAAG
jgi:hypothetical protein